MPVKSNRVSKYNFNFDFVTTSPIHTVHGCIHVCQARINVNRMFWTNWHTEWNLNMAIIDTLNLAIGMCKAIDIPYWYFPYKWNGIIHLKYIIININTFTVTKFITDNYHV